MPLPLRWASGLKQDCLINRFNKLRDTPCVI